MLSKFSSYYQQLREDDDNTHSHVCNSDAGKLDANDKANFTTQDSKVYIRFKNPKYDHWSEIECKYSDLGPDIEIKGCCVLFKKDYFSKLHNHSIGYVYKFSKHTKYEFSSFMIEFNFNGNRQTIARFVISYVQIQFENYNRTCSWRGDGKLKQASDSLNYFIHPCESVGPNYTYEVVAPVVPYHEVPSHKFHISFIESSTPNEDRLSSIESSTPQEVRLSSIESSTPQEVRLSSIESSTPQEVRLSSIESSTPQEVRLSSIESSTPQEVRLSSIESSTPQEVRLSSIESSTPQEVRLSSIESSTPQEVRLSSIESSTPQEVRLSSIESSTPQEVRLSSIESSTPQEVRLSSIESSTPHEVRLSSIESSTLQEVRLSSIESSTPHELNSSGSSSKFH
ncbi:Periaxin [Thelohanellus kitauei]|uniref:Periaxin n=1 Tax=Thelohanellus kitauei TaxID=669202 RepID=A0A0C2JHJ3_THEKT|nr:Periaxin [Thelohanellus kitauei]